MKREETAQKLYTDGLFCSQAVLAAYADKLGVTHGQALKIAAGFNSGMRKGEVCGACAGAVMVLGMLFTEDSADETARAAAKKTGVLTSKFLDAFKAANGSYICNELMDADISTPAGAADALSRGCFKTVCPKLVASAAEILETIIAEEEKTK